MRNTLLAFAAAAIAAFVPAAAHAELPVGAKAPLFSTQSARAGKVLNLNLARALRRGPVVLYFFPKAFTSGCTLEAHAFADANGAFERAGARVIGMSADNIKVLRLFSTEACRDKFSVARATPEIIQAYDVDTQGGDSPSGIARRTSYVIERDGRIAFVYSNPDYRDHVRLTLAAVQDLGKKR